MSPAGDTASTVVGITERRKIAFLLLLVSLAASFLATTMLGSSDATGWFQPTQLMTLVAALAWIAAFCTQPDEAKRIATPLLVIAAAAALWWIGLACLLM